MAGKRILALLVLSLWCAGTAVAQGVPQATLSGRVVNDGLALPGVAVTVKSPALQGVRTTVTSTNGDYVVPLLPPGEYAVTFALQGFQPVTRQVKLSAAQSTRTDVVLSLASIEATAIVVAQSETISQSGQAATTYTSELIGKLPVTRTLATTVNLAPGVNRNGPAASITMSGAQSFENLFLVNGVVVNENLRGQPLDLFIEDAVQETTTSTAAISAEYGRFQGGVVNALTKSGGNSFSGSFRTTFTNDDWIAPTSFNEQRVKKVVPTYEATLGGFLWKDRAWFFGAGRTFEREESRGTAVLATPYTRTDDETRLEAKLTVNAGPSHTLRASYLSIDAKRKNDLFSGAMDLASLSDREDPQQLFSANYNGVLSDSFFLEAQYSRRDWEVAKGNGAKTTDLIGGTILRDRSRSGSPRYHSPTFCGVCDTETRDNDNVLAKATWFLSTKSLGSHNLVGGVDLFDDQRFANNHQSGSDYRILGTSAIYQGADIYPRIASGSTFIQWWPIFEGSKGNSFQTLSVFVNDSWQLNDRLSFNVGARWDKNQGKNASGLTVADDSQLSPRVGAAWDVRGNGALKLTASFARYVAAINNAIGDSSAGGGNPSFFEWIYRGPAINPDPNATTLVSQDEAIRRTFDWFFANGGRDLPLRQGDVSGVTTVIRGSLKSPSTDELAVGATFRLGSRGTLRTDGIWRKAHDFYSTRVDTSTGTVYVPQIDSELDLGVVENTNDLEREYRALQTQFAYRPLEGLSVGGNWTWSTLRGSFDGETLSSGPVTGSDAYYPEYSAAGWSRPVGYLSTDQRHKVRLWANWEVPLPGRFGRVGLGLLQAIDSGLPYDAQALIDTDAYVTNPGYVTPDTQPTYYFTARGAYRTPTVTQTDLSLNYALPFAALGASIELFVQPQVANVFNQQEIATTDSRYFDTSVTTAVTNAALQPFDPATQTPVEGVHWKKGARFGQATNGLAFQTPRTYRISVGLRF
ncbi:MAG: TonB-dependent receptor [Holophagales bacterium]|nr:TonB-dependent receptor [Holophagales bacterium]